MEFTGRLYYDFASPEVFRFFRLLVGAEAAGATIRLEWRAFPSAPAATDRAALAVSELVHRHQPERHGGFIRAVLVAVHLEATSPADRTLPALAGRVAGVAPELLGAEAIADEGARLLAESEAEGREVGVAAVPTLYRHGPALRLRTTPAVTQGDPVERLRIIDAVLDDDGLWELSKP